jgi:hypothetical protein
MNKINTQQMLGIYDIKWRIPEYKVMSISDMKLSPHQKKAPHMNYVYYVYTVMCMDWL